MMCVCMYICMYVCMYKRKFSITYNDSVLKRSQPVPVQVWLLLLCWRKREALVNQMEKSHHIFMEYLFIRFQHNSFLMSTKYLQYLLKILSVTLSAQVSPVTPTIPGHTEQFQTCVAAASNQSQFRVFCFCRRYQMNAEATKKGLFCHNPSVSQVRARIPCMSRLKSAVFKLRRNLWPEFSTYVCSNPYFTITNVFTGSTVSQPWDTRFLNQYFLGYKNLFMQLESLTLLLYSRVSMQA